MAVFWFTLFMVAFTAALVLSFWQPRGKGGK